MRAFLSLFAAFAVLSSSSSAPALDGTTSFSKLFGSWGNARGLGCETCRVAASVLQFLFRANATEEEMEKALIKFCIDQKIEDDNVCNLVVREFKVYNIQRSKAKSFVVTVRRETREEKERRGERARGKHG